MRLNAGSSGVKALLLHQIGVHAGGKVVAILLFKRALGACGRRVQFLPQQVAVALAEQREGPRPAHLVGGNGIVLDPVAAGVLVEIRAGIGGLVDGREIEALDGRGWRGFGGVGIGGGLRQGTAGREQQNGYEANAIHRISSWKQGSIGQKHRCSKPTRMEARLQSGAANSVRQQRSKAYHGRAHREDGCAAPG